MLAFTTTRQLPAPAGRGLTAGSRALRRVGILGTGAHVPDAVLDNAALERIVETSDEWIVARTGIRERRVAGQDEATSDLATRAARRALEAANLEPSDVGVIVVATSTPDQVTPSTACHVQRELGATGAAGFDIGAACSGFVNAQLVGHQLIAAGAFEHALVIGADKLSAITDYENRESCILFGDGAGAVVLGADPDGGELLDHVIGIDGRGADVIQVAAGGSRRPTSAQTLAAREHFLSMRGREVFKFAVSKCAELVRTIVERNGFAVDDLDLVVPHQANLRIIEAAAKKLGLPLDRFAVNGDRYGNTAAASVPIALDEAARSGRLARGHLVCEVVFGGGLSWGASLLRW